MDHQSALLASVMCPEAMEAAQTRRHQQLMRGDETLDDDGVSLPVPYNHLCAEIPEAEDESFKAVR